MKKVTNSTILVLTIVTTYIQADGLYIGLEQSLLNSVSNETEICNSSYSNSKSSNPTSFKIGSIMGKSDKDNHVEILYSKGEKSANPTGGLEGESLTSFSFFFNITTPSWSPKEEIIPYIRFGSSYTMSNDKYRVQGTDKKEKYSATGLILGIGDYYQVAENINLSVGFDYQYRIWDKLSNNICSIESTDKVKKLYVGVDYLF